MHIVAETNVSVTDSDTEQLLPTKISIATEVQVTPVIFLFGFHQFSSVLHHFSSSFFSCFSSFFSFGRPRSLSFICLGRFVTRTGLFHDCNGNFRCFRLQSAMSKMNSFQNKTKTALKRIFLTSSQPLLRSV